MRAGGVHQQRGQVSSVLTQPEGSQLCDHNFLRAHALRRRTCREGNHPEGSQRRYITTSVDHVEVVGVRGKRADDGDKEDDHGRVDRVDESERDIAPKHPAGEGQ